MGLESIIVRERIEPFSEALESNPDDSANEILEGLLPVQEAKPRELERGFRKRPERVTSPGACTTR